MTVDMTSYRPDGAKPPQPGKPLPGDFAARSFCKYYLSVFRSQYVSSDGRTSRRDFWCYLFWQMLLGLLLAFFHISGTAYFPAGASIVTAVSVLLGLIMGLPLIFLCIRRIHDIGISGWWLNFCLVGLWIVPLIMCLLPGQAGENKYGIDPRLAVRGEKA
ncbi:MAG: DUF805 domain-containing protein [Deltaproteobacteria bacterium]|nr:DUF805 domain-containing protein [Deltaproteobacteria bacterium]